MLMPSILLLEFMVMERESSAGKTSYQNVDLPKHLGESEEILGSGGTMVKSLGSDSFTTFFTWNANGTHPAVRFDHPSINSDSRVFVSISEFSSDARLNRFIGGARMAVFNVAPFNGGFHAWVEIAWDDPRPVRFDVLVDP
jgi:hypothetical protein